MKKIKILLSIVVVLVVAGVGRAEKSDGDPQIAEAIVGTTENGVKAVAETAENGVKAVADLAGGVQTFFERDVLAIPGKFIRRSFPEPSGLAFGLGMTNFSKYILRGQNLDDDPVFQSSISATYGSLTAAIWGNLELTNINGHSGDFTELDYSLDYSGSFSELDGVGYSVGVIYYDFPGTLTKDTTEVYWALNFELPLSPSIIVLHDVDEAEGSYVSFALAHSIEKILELSPDLPVGMDIGASLGWGSGSYNKYYWGTDQSKLNDLALSVSFPLEIAGWTIAPSLNYVTLVSDDIRSTDTYGTDSDFFFAGVSLSTSF